MKVLIVDDDPTITGTLFDTLSGIGQGVEPIEASQAPAALQHVGNKAITVALIDLRLTQHSGLSPGKAIYNGIRLGEDIRKKSPSTLIVMYSGDILPGSETQFPHYADC